MSDPTDIPPGVTAPDEVTERIEPVAPASEPMPEMTALAPPLASGHPYRVPEAELARPEHAWPVPPPPRRPWPILGPALGVFAVLLWSYVVAGQLTTSWMTGGGSLDGKLAFAMVLGLTLTSFIANLRRSRIAQPPTRRLAMFGRAIGMFTLAFVAFVVTVMVATIFGASSTRNHDLAIAFALVVVAMVAALLAPRVTSIVTPARTHRMRVVLVTMWIGGALLTLVAGVQLATNG